MSKQIWLTGIKKLFPGCHIEAMKGSIEQNRKYCSKESELTELGVCPAPGKRTDLLDCMADIRAGKRKRDCMEEHAVCYARHVRFMNEYRQCVEKDERAGWRDVHVQLSWGRTNTGKTRAAMLEDPYKIQASHMQWFDNYEGESTLLINEYNNDCQVTTMLALLDGYRLRLPIKGGFTYANWDKVIVTTNLEPDELHPLAKPEHRRALFRRITVQIKFD